MFYKSIAADDKVLLCGWITAAQDSVPALCLQQIRNQAVTPKHTVLIDYVGYGTPFQ